VADLNPTEHGPKIGLVFRDAWDRVWWKTSDGRFRRLRRNYPWTDQYQRALDGTPPQLDQKTFESLPTQFPIRGQESG
jgi:hypothetical protein